MRSGAIERDSNKSKISSVEIVKPKDDLKKEIRLSITNKCDFDCFFCHAEGFSGDCEDKALAVEDILRIVSFFQNIGVKKIKLTGGDPLNYKKNGHDIVYLVEKLSKLKSSSDFNLSLTTNGLLLKKFAKLLKGAGLDSVNISLTTLKPEKMKKYVGGKNYLNDVSNILKGIKQSIDTDLNPVKINFIMIDSNKKQRGNLTEIHEVLERSLSLGVDEVKFYNLIWHPKFVDFHNYYVYWSEDRVIEKISSAIYDLYQLNLSKSEIKGAIKEQLKNFSETNESTLYPKKRIKFCFKKAPDISFECTSFGRFRETEHCKDCNFRERCQEGPYALRCFPNGRVGGCLLKEGSFDLLNALKSRQSDESKIIEKIFNLFP